MEDLYEPLLNIDLVKEFLEVAYLDDKPDFVSMMKTMYESPTLESEKVGKGEPDDTEAKYCPRRIFDLIFGHGAVDCATALLEGETGFIVDLNLPNISGACPLHLAAEELSYDMIDLFLRHGARTDIRTIDGVLKGDLLPLNIALEKLSLHCYLVDWTPKQSIFKLIAVLCLPQMKVPLDVNRLLAWNTKEVNEIFNHYAMEGKFIEMAALLMVAREKVMASSMFQCKDSFGLDGMVMIRRSILQEIALLTDEEIKSTGNSRNCKSVRMLKNMKAMMKFSLMLLEVFERAGDAIETYRQAVQSEMPTEKLVKDIKALLEEAGFVLKDNDIDLSNINCGRENIYVATKVLEQRSTFGSQLQDLRMQLHSPSGSFRKENPYHTLRSSDGRYAIPRSIVVHRSSKKATTPVKISASYLLSSRKFASFALAIKRGITYI